jgi:hypothetical protein
MSPPLAVHSDVGLVVNDRWEKAPLTAEDLKKIKPLLEKIKTLKQKGLISFGIVANYIRFRVQPLKARETYGFEYAGADDPSQLVPSEELTEGEVLQRLCKILKGVSVIPHRIDEHDAANPPSVVSVHVLRFIIFSSSMHNILMWVELM